MPTKTSLCFAVVLLSLFVQCPFASGQEKPADTVLAVVDGVEITEGDMAFLLMSRRIPKDQVETVRGRFLEILIERQLMRAFLDSLKAKPSQTELDEQVARIRKVIKDSGDDPDQVLGRLGMSDVSLRRELALPLTWKSYLRLAVSNQQLRKYYEKHREKFDGTQVQVSQIFLKLPADAEEAAVQAAKDRLETLKREVEASKVSFAEAAKEHSEAPSKEKGGDTGWITYRGKLPANVSDAAFTLKVGEISDPVRSPFGLHLVTVTERKPGELSLEDTRAVVFNHLSQKLWEETVKAQREKAKIEVR